MKPMLRPALVAVALAVGTVAIGSCYKIYNNVSPTVHCGGACDRGKGRPDPAPPLASRTLARASNGKLPVLFLTADDGTGRCENVQGAGGYWSGRVLLPGVRGADPLASAASCGYVWLSDALVPPEPALLSRAGLTGVRVDPPSLAVQQANPPSPAASLSPAQIESWHQDRYATMRARLGSPGSSPPQVGGVRVAVIDTSTDDFYHPAPEQLGSHGRAVGKLVENVACEGHASCRVSVRNYGALPLSTAANGDLRLEGSGAGDYGTPGMLAEAIHDALEDWNDERAVGTGPEHLVINLSVGWSGCYDDPGGDAEALQNVRHGADKRLGVHPVYRAILLASCQGALVVAAGGNVDAIDGCPAGAPRKKGELVFPAHFLSRYPRRPTPELCRRIVGVKKVATESLGPLLLGVSAVDETDAKLALAEQESTLVAHGNAVTVPDRGAWTHALTGTSVSAATVSGMAAAVWAAFPRRTAGQLERDLIAPAVELRRFDERPEPFLCNPLPGDGPLARCDRVRRAALCRSLDHARGVDDSDCGPVTPTVIHSHSLPETAIAAETACDSLACDGNIPPDAIDSVEQPWAVSTQPGGNSCGTCIYLGSARLFAGGFVKGSYAIGSLAGVLSLNSKSHALWTSTLTDPSLLRVLPPSASTSPNQAILKYVRNSSAGLIYYKEQVQRW